MSDTIEQQMAVVTVADTPVGSTDATTPSSETPASSSDSTVPATAVDAPPAATPAPTPAAPAQPAQSHEAKKFLLKHKEKLQMNQYWYSLPTISAMVAEVERESKRCAFLSTPSIFFSLNDKKVQDNSKVFDYDEMWAKHPGFVKYDYKKVEEIPADLHHTFDFVVVDPPFITAEVWAEYAKAIRLLLVEGDEEVAVEAGVADAYYESMQKAYEAGVASLKGEMLLSTIPEHEGYLYVMLGCMQPRFRPSIPNLIYQYSLYINYPSAPLAKLNPEIDDEEDEVNNKKFTSKKKSTIQF